MIKKYKNTLAIVFIFTLLLTVFLSCFSLLPVRASDEVNYKKKIVSVVYDNSGSMGMANEQKVELAKYSLQTLVSSLGINDELIVCPMNQYNSFEVDLSKTDRTSEILDVIVNNIALSPNGMTPLDSVDRAVAELTSRGMKKSADLGNEEPDKEYWLVILTDGQFDLLSKASECNDALESKIKDYAGLNTVYMSFGSGAVDLTDKDLSLNVSYPFFAYCVKDPLKVVDAMESVVNKILGKYGADAKTYAISDKTLIIDLDQFDFAVNSISVIAQNCGAVLKSASYNGKKISPVQCAVLNSCGVIGANGVPMNAGYTAVIKNDEYMSGGKLELVYDKALNDVSVLVEPAIFIDAYIEYSDNGVWKKTDMQFINGNLKPGDRIRIGYDVLSAADSSVVDTKTIFGEHVEKVTYCGAGYKIGEEIELREGNNEISITVEVLDGRYSMYSSLMCYVERNPTYYRIESALTQGTGDDYKKANVAFTVFANDQQLTKKELTDGYDWEITATDSDENPVTVGISLDNDGKIQVAFDGNALAFGNYRIKAYVVSKTSKISRTTTQIVAVAPKSVEVSCLNNDYFQISEYRLRETSEVVAFRLLLDGVAESFENDIVDYKVTLDGSDITDRCVIEEKELKFIINSDHLIDFSVGKKQIKVEVSAFGGISAQGVYDFEILSSVYRVEKLDYGERTFDRYNVSEANAGTYFKVYKDDVLISVEEIQEALDNGEITIDTNPIGWITLLPCGVNVTVTDIEGEPVIACTVVSDIFNPLDSLLGAFIFADQKDITLSYNGVVATDTVFMTPVSFVSRLIRWIILCVIILFILHLVLFGIGFFVAKPLPRGTLLKLKVNAEEYSEEIRISTQKLNMAAKDIILWHLSRLIPFREFKDQKPKTLFNLVMIGIDKKTRRPNATVQGRFALVEYTALIPANKDGTEIQNVVDGYKKGKGKTKIAVNSRSFLRFFRKTNSKYQKGDVIKSITDNDWYGIHKITDGQVDDLTGFIVFKHYRK